MSLIARVCPIANVVICVVICVVVIAVATPAQAGKLSRLRDKIEEQTSERKQSKSSENKPQRSRSKREISKSSSWVPAIKLARGGGSPKQQQRPSARSTQFQPPEQANIDSTANYRKLDRVSSTVRKDAPKIVSSQQHGRQPSVHNAHRDSRYHRPSRPGRSPYRIGLHFGSALYPAYSPEPPSYTIIEEHYYGDPAVVRAQSTEPVFAADSYVMNTPSLAADYPPHPEPFVEPPVVTDEYVSSSFETPVATLLKPWNVRLGIEYVGDTNDNLSQFGFDFLANATAGFGVDTDIRMLREHGVDFRDHLWLGDVNLVYELFPSECVRPRVGMGLNWLTDSYGSEAGLNLTVGADVQLLSRLTLTGEADFGTLGDSDFFHANATVGLQQSEHVEWYAGYDYVDIGGVRIESIVGGLRFRF